MKKIAKSWDWHYPAEGFGRIDHRADVLSLSQRLLEFKEDSRIGDEKIWGQTHLPFAKWKI